MSQVVTLQSAVQPRAVTLAQLRAKLLPHCHGWHWGEDTITDLWKLGAPLPSSGPGQEEQRILLPGQFRKWWAELQQRLESGVSAATAYVEVTGR